MVSSEAQSPEEYLAALPEDRREALSTLRKVILDNLPAGFAEGMQFGMIGYYIPLERFPDTYNGQPLGLAAIASQKHHMALYLNNVYGDVATEKRFRERYAASGRKLDMGKSCVRFRRIEDLPLDVIAKTIAEVSADGYLARYQAARGSSRATRREA